MNRRGPAALVAGTVAFVCIIHAYGCKNDGTHVYQARFYLEGRDCLGTTSALDVVDGEEPGNDCEAICFRQVRGDAGRAIHVSSMCPPYPVNPDFERSGSDPACPAALAALARNDTCLSDGGSTAPIRDAGGD